MYLEELKITNTGPIKKIHIFPKMNDSGEPLPIIIVGRNGSGKSIFLSNIVNSLIAAHATVFNDSDVTAGTVYKVRSSMYVANGEEFSSSYIKFSKNLITSEIQLRKVKSDYKQPLDYEFWLQIKKDDASHFFSNFKQNIPIVTSELNEGVHIFFPPNRYEDPAWLNELNLINKVDYLSLKRYSGISNRPVIHYTPLKEIQNWLLDLIYDANAIEKKEIIRPDGTKIFIANGPASKILEQITSFIRKMLNIDEGLPLQWLVGRRGHRGIGLSTGEQQIFSNLFSLSTGQLMLIDIFLTIIKDSDFSSARINNLSEIKGIVIIDEIDMHLHINFQHDILPNIIRLFPNIQFIITTHSPFFLIGMHRTFGEQNIQIIELPAGNEISAENFTEFEVAFNKFKESSTYNNNIQLELQQANRPTIYFEGATDLDYIKRAAELHNKNHILTKYELKDGGGAQNLDKIWRVYKDLKESPSQEMILIYDCDVRDMRKDTENYRNIHRLVLTKTESKIDCGIENLFPECTLQRTIDQELPYINTTKAHEGTKRGHAIQIKETWEIDSNEKRNLCNWICTNGTKDDFENFLIIFDYLEKLLNKN